MPLLYSKKTSLVWIDLKQPPSKSKAAGTGGEEDDGLLEREQKNENWWPGLKRWHVGLSFEDASLTISEPEILTA